MSGSREIRLRVASRLYRFLTGKSPVPANTNIFLEPGHFYSPLPDLADVRSREAEVFGPLAAELAGIELRTPSQLALLETFGLLYRDMPFTAERQPGMRTYLNNPRYAFLDAIILHCMLRHLSPQRVIEVGSGYSSCVTLDTNERFLDGRAELTFVDPYPDVLLELLDANDPARGRIVQRRLQEFELDRFTELEMGDVLFIDSTHVAKVGSDVNHLFFKILPALRSGVVVHIHDIFYPFEYPKEWIYEGRAWNEAYLLHAYLMHNSAYEIIFWNDYLAQFHRAALGRALPLGLQNTGGAIWLRKK